MNQFLIKKACIRRLCCNRSFSNLQCFHIGDPGCIWSEGQTPSRLTNITHPGICEPVDSPKCNFQTWVSCSGRKANCSGRTEPGVLKTDIRFPRYNVRRFIWYHVPYICHKGVLHIITLLLADLYHSVFYYVIYDKTPLL